MRRLDNQETTPDNKHAGIDPVLYQDRHNRALLQGTSRSALENSVLSLDW